MKKSTLFYLSLVSILFGACASVGTNMGPSFTEWDTGEHRQYVKVTFVNNHAFAPSTTTTMILECRYLRGTLSLQGKTGEEILRDSQCRPADVGNQAVGAGILPGFGSSIVQSAGIVGSAYLLGKGIAKSGDTHTNNSKTYNDNYNENEADADARAHADAEADAEADSYAKSEDGEVGFSTYIGDGHHHPYDYPKK